MVSIKLITEILEKSSKRISRSNYPVFILSSSNTLLANEVIMRKLQSLNQENKNIKISRICGLNNSAGFVNSCIVKSGSQAH